MTEQETLKARLKLKQIQKQIDEAVEENFGYSPDGEWFDRLLTERDQLLEKLK